MAARSVQVNFAVHSKYIWRAIIFICKCIPLSSPRYVCEIISDRIGDVVFSNFPFPFPYFLREQTGSGPSSGGNLGGGSSA